MNGFSRGSRYVTQLQVPLDVREHDGRQQRRQAIRTVHVSDFTTN